jgi:predicted flap endonuclease-1-like 5' DNA nuclease
MAYLITQLMWWLIAAAAFASLSGWAYYAMRARPKLDGLERERSRLMGELVHAAPAGSFSGVGVLGYEREIDTLRRRGEIDAARIAELERGLDVARKRAESAGEADAEVETLRRQLADMSEARAAEADAADAEAADSALVKAWRLRYFEQRVRYLEGLASTAPNFATLEAPVAEPEPAPEPVAAVVEDRAAGWRARYYEQRTHYLEDALRAAPVQAAAPVAAPVQVAAPDWREAQNAAWRLRYLSKRVAYLQEQAAAAPEPEPEPESESEIGEDFEALAERRKWRVRYLESRLRHFERAPAPVELVGEVIDEDEDDDAPAPRGFSAPANDAVRPASLPAARGGAPEDLTLIEGVSLLQHSTLNSLGVYHFDQIAAWSPGNVAWVDHYLRLRGRIVEEDWVAQAQALARGEGIALSERVPEDEPA